MASKFKNFLEKFKEAFNPIGGLFATAANWKSAGDKVKAEKELKEFRDKQDVLLNEIKEGRADAEEQFNKVVEEFPVYQSNPALMQELRDMFTEAENQSRTALGKYESSISKSREGLARAEEEARSGLDASLDRLRRLTKKDYLPGQRYAEEQIGQSTVNALTNLKRLGGGRGSLSALSDIYASEQAQKRQLGEQSAQTRLNLDLNLAGAEKEAGLVMSDLLRSNAVTNANLGAGLYNAFSDFTNRKISNAQTIYGAETAQDIQEYQSRTVPARMEVDFARSQYFETNPYNYESELLATDRGFAYSDYMTAENQIRENNKMITDMLKNIATLGLSAATGNPTPAIGAFTGGGNQPVGQIADPTGASTYDMWGQYRKDNPYYQSPININR